MARVSLTVESSDVDGSVRIDLHDHETEEEAGGLLIDHDGDNLLVHVTRLDEAIVGAVRVVVH